MVSKPQAFDTGSGDDGRKRSMLAKMRRQTEDIIRYYGELNRRVAGAGMMEGIPKLLELSKQLELALDELSEQELGWAGDEIKRLVDQLVAITTRLEHLRELKSLFSAPPAVLEAPRRRTPLPPS